MKKKALSVRHTASLNQVSEKRMFLLLLLKNFAHAVQQPDWARNTVFFFAEKYFNY